MVMMILTMQSALIRLDRKRWWRPLAYLTARQRLLRGTFEVKELCFSYLDI